MFLQGGEEQGSESEEPSRVEDDGTTLDDIKVKQRKESLIYRHAFFWTPKFLCGYNLALASGTW